MLLVVRMRFIYLVLKALPLTPRHLWRPKLGGGTLSGTLIVGHLLMLYNFSDKVFGSKTLSAGLTPLPQNCLSLPTSVKGV